MSHHSRRPRATSGSTIPKTKLAIVGDLVVDIVPFMDTACPDGWLKALDEIERTPFMTLIPGHGPVMNRRDFGQWKTAFAEFVDLRPVDRRRDRIASPAGKRVRRGSSTMRIATMSAKPPSYYITTRLRSSPDEQQRYCKPLRP